MINVCILENSSTIRRKQPRTEQALFEDGMMLGISCNSTMTILKTDKEAVRLAYLGLS
jgi:hypothetical protein